MKHLLKMSDLTPDEVAHILDVADELKAQQKAGGTEPLLKGKSVALMFSKNSTRTRTSFEVGVYQLGGLGNYMNAATELQSGRGEPLKDTARVLGRYYDCVVWRTYRQSDLEEFAEFAGVPVINGLTDYAHPCQVLADLMTIRERRGALAGQKLCFVGDGSNMANSLIVGGLLSGMKVDIELNFAVCADNAAKVQEARRIAEDMEAVGLSVNLRELTWKDYVAALRTGYIDADQEEPEIPMDMYLAEVALTGDWNILTLISGDWEEDNTLNYGGWENSELEQLTEAYLGAKDDDRAQAVRDWLQLLTTTTVILPVCFETRDVISHLGTISGMSPNQYDIFNNITAWTVHIG